MNRFTKIPVTLLAVLLLGCLSGVVATPAGAQTDTAVVKVYPFSYALKLGNVKTMIALPYSASGTIVPRRPVTWQTSNPAVVTVSATGAAHAVGGGTATITATIDGVSGTSVLTVDAPLPAVGIRPTTVQPLAVGSRTLAYATAVDANGHPALGDFRFSWTSSNPAVAKVSRTGVIQAVKAGTATITATSGRLTGTTTVTVTASPARVQVSPSGIAKVEVYPTYQRMQQGQVRAMMVVLLRDRNGAIMPMKGRKVTWTSSDPSVASPVGPAAIQGNAPGFATITATVEGISGSSQFVITRPY